jgi:hypothetical protein
LTLRVIGSSSLYQGQEETPKPPTIQDEDSSVLSYVHNINRDLNITFLVLQNPMPKENAKKL